MTTTRTAAEALEEVLAQIAAVDGRSGMDRLEARLDSANAARNFIMKHAATLRAALAQPPCPGVSHPGCNYLAACGTVCTKCGQLVSGPTAPQEGEVEECADRLEAMAEGYSAEAAKFFRNAARLLRATQSNGHSPVGDESPRQNAKGAEGCHDAPNASGESPAQSAPVQEPVITVSGPVACGKSYIMELIYKALRDAGLHPYSDDLAHERRMVEEQPQPPAKVWKLREAVYAAPPPSAPAHEPVAWRYKERINCGQGQYIDSDWKLASFRPMLGGSSDGGCSSGVTHLEPLYAAPQQDEAK